MTTWLKKLDTVFLPFNKGYNKGASNPPVNGGYRTAYLWKEVLQRDSILDILHRFVQVTKDEKSGNMYSCWCLVSIRVKNRYFEYEKTDDELFDFGELMELRRNLNKAVNDKISKMEFIDFMEPDIDFRVESQHANLHLHLSGCNTQYYVVPLYKDDVKALKAYIDSRISLLKTQWQERHNGATGGVAHE